ncbi:MAG: signal peptidase II, partial [Congregibacter sp.]|nr:signal peptidase II [Congregibacter sp.]
MVRVSSVTLPKVLAAWRWYVLASVIVILDQGSKWLASTELTYAMPVKLVSWFNLTLHHNQGAAFSFLADAGGWQRWFFAGLALAVSAMIVFWLRDLKPRQWPLSLALALVLGGALGNLVDRILLGYVVDFISVHYQDWYFPTFNVADSAISVGAALIVVDSLFMGTANGRSSESGR